MPSYLPNREPVRLPSAIVFGDRCRRAYTLLHSSNLRIRHHNAVSGDFLAFEREFAWLALSPIHKAIFDRALGVARSLLVCGSFERVTDETRGVELLDLMDACTCAAIDAAHAGHAALSGYEAHAGAWLAELPVGDDTARFPLHPSV